jgi:hypothetical protein
MTADCCRVYHTHKPGDKDQMDRKAARGMDAIEYNGDTVSFAEVDVSDPAMVWMAAADSAVLVNCSVARWQRRASFDVNCRGVRNCIRAAVGCGHDRVINTGPHWTHTGERELLSVSPAARLAASARIASPSSDASSHTPRALIVSLPYGYTPFSHPPSLCACMCVCLTGCLSCLSLGDTHRLRASRATDDGVRYHRGAAAAPRSGAGDRTGPLRVPTTLDLQV